MSADQPSVTVARRGLMLVLSSPSGAGKSTITRHLLQTDPNVSLSISATSRPPRPGEEEGIHYFFHTQDSFKQMIDEDALLEWAEVFGAYYGTPKAPVESALQSGRDVLFDIDWQGTRLIKEKARKDLVSIFILPPSLAELERRLRARGQDDLETIRYRMERAMDEISHYAEYDYILVNDELNASIAKVQGILAAERHKRNRQNGLPDFVAGLNEQQKAYTAPE